MIHRLAAACFVLVLVSGFAAAQDAPSGAGDFCAAAPEELLVALDGNWSLEQGAGLAIGGFPIPLPAHPPVAMRLEYDAQGGHAILSGQGQQMVMVPVLTETANEFLGDEFFGTFASATEGMVACDWYALPTLVGSNAYALRGTVEYEQIHGNDDSGDWDLKPLFISLCIGDREYGVFLTKPGGGRTFKPFDDPRPDECKEGLIQSAGDMLMTITLKFDSPSSARGMLTFTGESDGYSFAAWAPITMVR